MHAFENFFPVSFESQPVNWGLGVAVAALERLVVAAWKSPATT